MRRRTDDRTDHLSLSNREPAWRGRDGDRVCGARPPAESPGRAQVRARRARARRPRARTAPKRSADGVRAQPSQHLHHLRHRRAQRPAVHRHGVADRHHASGSARCAPAWNSRGCRYRYPGGRRALPGAQQRRHPSRHQAGQSLPGRSHTAEDPRFRSGQVRRAAVGTRRFVYTDGRADHRRRDGWHRGLHVAGAGLRRAARSAHGPVLAGRGAVRVRDRPSAVQGQDLGCRALVDPDPGADRRDCAERRGAASISGSGQHVPRKGSRAALPGRGRITRRPQADQTRP